MSDQSTEQRRLALEAVEQIEQQLAPVFGDDTRLSARKGIGATREQWAALVAFVRALAGEETPIP